MKRASDDSCLLQIIRRKKQLTALRSQINKELTGAKNTAIYIRNMSNYRDIDIPKYAEMFKALSNPNRLRIFLRLITCCKPGTVSSIFDCGEPEGCACVGELGQDLGIVPSTISHHIKELRQAGLIRMERQGQKIACWIDPDAVEALRSFFG
jgi:ArsR family transcriptional regulator